jgi:hypothetical protein
MLLFAVGSTYTATAGDSAVSALAPQMPAIVPWIERQQAWFKEQLPDRYHRLLAFGACASPSGTCEWLAYANASGYVQLNLSCKLTDEDRRSINRIKFPENSVERWRTSSETRGIGGGTLSWIGTTDQWTTLHCTPDFRCDNQKIISAILERLNTASTLQFAVKTYYP